MSPRTQIIDVCPLDELGPGEVRRIAFEDWDIGVVNCEGTIYAIEDRCSHDSGVLLDGELDAEGCAVECPRHGSWFDLKTGQARNLPAYAPVETFPVLIDGGMVRLEVD